LLTIADICRRLARVERDKLDLLRRGGGCLRGRLPDRSGLIFM